MVSDFTVPLEVIECVAVVLELLEVGLGKNCFGKVLRILLLVEEFDVGTVAILLEINLNRWYHLFVDKIIFIE